MKFNTTYLLGLLTVGILAFSSCFNDLDTVPIDPDEFTANVVFDSPESYKEVLAKLYAGLAVSGQEGPAGQADISGIDEGFGQYLRGYWYMQELTTDEAVIGWNDQTIQDLHGHSWTSSDVFISAFYYRIFFQVVQCNEFLRETSEAKLNERNVDAALRAEIATYRAEARFLRALSYWHALDIFANPPFVTEEDKVGAFFPEQTNRADLFSYIESELLDMEPLLVAPGLNEYARADRAAAWILLAKLYLNAEVYIGQDRSSDCVKYCGQIINAGYTIDDNYEHLFLADNHKAAGVIFPVAFDGINTRTFGGTTFIIHASVGGEMIPDDSGIDNGWGGTRTTSAFVNLFDQNDGRAMFFTEGQSLEITDISLFTDGYAITKFKNITSDGMIGKDATYTDTDFPMFRLADAYLMYAEGVVRGGAGGDIGTAVNLVNQLRERAFGNADNNIGAADLTLDFLLAERGRELYWECHRRTDLIRFGQFTDGTYQWPWKGNTPEGVATSSHLNLFPIPASDLAANPSLDQNPGY